MHVTLEQELTIHVQAELEWLEAWTHTSCRHIISTSHQFVAEVIGDFFHLGMRKMYLFSISHVSTVIEYHVCKLPSHLVRVLHTTLPLAAIIAKPTRTCVSTKNACFKLLP
jgi:hypothetical protein